MTSSPQTLFNCCTYNKQTKRVYNAKVIGSAEPFIIWRRNFWIGTGQPTAMNVHQRAFFDLILSELKICVKIIVFCKLQCIGDGTEVGFGYRISQSSTVAGTKELGSGQHWCFCYHICTSDAVKKLLF